MSDSETVAPPHPIATDAVPWTVLSDVPRFALRYRHLTRALLGDAYRVGVVIEELPPGAQSAPAHYHLFEEEHVLVLEGRMTARLGAERHALAAGDYICFPAGQKAGHCLINDGDAPCRYVLIGEKNPDDVIVYTDTGKVLVRGLGRRAIFDLTAQREYWEGEETGLPPGVQVEEDAAPPLAAPETAPRQPISVDAVAWEPTRDGGSFGGRARHLTYAAVGSRYHVGVLIESADPGKRLWPRHYHLMEEEHALILDGEATLLLGDERIPMRAGDYVCFPAGQALGHSFLNSGTAPCRYLMIGERHPADVCIYPDSRKMAVSAIEDGPSVFDATATRSYWDGET